MNRRERRSKKMNRGLGEVIDHTKYVRNYKFQVMRVIRDIESGIVNEEDLAKLRNYCQMSLRLMEKSPMSMIQSAWRDIEIAALLHDAVEDIDDVGGYLKDGTPVAMKNACSA